jgi:hypothetical protein
MNVLTLRQQSLLGLGWVIGLVLCSAVLLAVHRWTIPAEDAVILYDYARSLSTKGVISYGGSVAPIEGATDFLWMLLIAGMGLVGVDQFAAALCLTGLAMLGLIKGFGTTWSRLWVLAGWLATPYLYASLSGFSAVFFGACFVLCIHLCMARHPATCAAVLLMCLIRPDGVVWGAGIVAWMGLRAWQEKGFGHFLRPLLWQLVLPGTCYFLWRAWYFSEWLPLPFLVKAAGQRDMVLFFKDSLEYVGLATVPLALVVLWRRKMNGLIQEALLLFLMPVIFYSVMRLEQNIGNRFLAPIFLGGSYWLFRRAGTSALAALVLLSVIAQFNLTAQTLVKLLNSRSENVYAISRALSQLDGRMLITESGRLAYYSHWFAEDSWGLNTPRYAHEMIRGDMIGRAGYDLIVAHCDVTLLRPDASLIHGTERSWDNHCKEIVAHLRQGGYKIYLAPFLRPGATTDAIKTWLKPGRQLVRDRCERYDIYAVSLAYPRRATVEKILMEHLAVPYDSSLELKGGDLVCP